MNLWIMVAITIGLIAMAGILVTAWDTSKQREDNNLDCSSCGNSCTAESNCGLSTCGATQGKTCGCRG